jgi:hypothetical protein
MVNPQDEKKSNVNQSINADIWRLSVGSANAAKVARAGKDNKSVRSGEAEVSVVTMVIPAYHTGSIRWRCRLREKSCRRQRHRVQMARGAAGHGNHKRSCA